MNILHVFFCLFLQVDFIYFLTRDRLLELALLGQKVNAPSAKSSSVTVLLSPIPTKIRDSAPPPPAASTECAGLC